MASLEASCNNQVHTEELELNHYIEETSARILSREKTRHDNNNVEWPQDDYFLKLDSSLKKNSSFVKKLRQFTANCLDSFMKGNFFILLLYTDPQFIMRT